MQVNIREAVSDDYMSIFGLIKNELGYGHLDYDKLCVRLEEMKANDSYLTIVAELDGRVVGFIGFDIGLTYNYESERIYILALAVAKEHQRQGIGARLSRWVEDYATGNGIRIIVLTSRFQRTGAHAFYEQNGYSKKSFGFYKELNNPY